MLSINVNRNILISLGNVFYKLVCRETSNTKSAFVRVESSSRADPSVDSLVPTSVSFERTPENMLELAFKMVTAFSQLINLKLFSFTSARLWQAYFHLLILLPLQVSGNWLLIEQIQLLSLFTVKDTNQNNL